MKAKEAPEKLYVDTEDILSDSILYGFTEKRKENDIEYTRTDAFVEKAVKWLEENASLFVALADEEHPAIGDTKATYGTKSLIYYFKQEFEI